MTPTLEEEYARRNLERLLKQNYREPFFSKVRQFLADVFGTLFVFITIILTIALSPLIILSIGFYKLMSRRKK